MSITMNKVLQSSMQLALLSSAMVLTACSPSDQPESTQKAPNIATESPDASDDLKEQIEAKPVKAFAPTANDANDIALLEKYTTDFDALSTSLEEDIQRLEAQGNMTDDIKLQRKRDLIQSSLNMLKELDLKTEQGRYIQGLYYQYWENQMFVYNELIQSPNNELRNPKDAVENMGEYYTAEAQLKHWKAQ